MPEPEANASPQTGAPPRRPAPLRRLLLLALCAGLALWVLAQLASTHFLVGRSYRDFESQDGLTNAMRLDGFLAGESKRLRRIARDWAYWDDARSFMEGTNPGFPAELFDDQTFGNNAIDLAVMAKPDGTPTYVRHIDSTTLERRSGATEAVREFLASDAARRVVEAKREITGLLRTEDGLLLFAAVPVLDNQRSAPPAGILIYGRDLDEHVLEEARQETILDVAFLTAGDAGWPADATRIWDRVEQAPQHLAQAISDDRFGAYVVLRDYAGSPVGLLRAVTHRDAKARFESVGLFLIASNLLLGGLLALGLAWFLERRVHEPLAGIRRVIGAVARDGDLDQRVPPSGHADEFAGLGAEVNGMLAEVANQRSLREARDNALAQAAEKSRFLANMSHEIRTPMNSILGMLELVLETQLSAQQQERVQAAYRSAESLLALLNDILDYSKLEDGRLTLEQHEFDLLELVEGVVTLFAPACEQKGISISCFVEPGLGRQLGDAPRVRQILTNLVGNAVKFTAQGEVTVEAKPAAEPGCVQFVVADTGIGIPHDHLQTLFQPFTQIETASSRRYGGTGLGLAICSQLVERMQGRLDVASAPGSGSRFACTLRLDPVPGSDAREMRGAHVGKHALVLGPRDGTREALAGYLEALGFTVGVRAQSASIPLRDSGPLDLLVLDETIGGTAASTLRAEAARSRIPVLRLANFATAQAAALAGRLPQSDGSQVLGKPVLFGRLGSALDRLFGSTENLPAARPVEPLSTGGLAGKRVLLVEDNAVNMALALGMLEAYSVTVDCAENGVEALAKLGESRYDLVLMDCQMPELDGLEATRRWRAEESSRGAGRVPIVALTANAMAGDREACLACGMDDYLAKPFTRANLAGVLLDWIGRDLALAPAAADAAP
jgi:signal transduction histidine kinase/CheY-like chemotaxis protein